MTFSKKLVVGVTVPVLFVCAVAAFAYVGLLSTTPACSSWSTSSNTVLNGGIYSRPPTHPTSLTLHPVSYIQARVNHSLILPSSTTLGSCLSVVGVRMNGVNSTQDFPRVNDSAGQMVEWSVTIYLWNRVPVNGTTTDADILNNGGIAIVESAAPPGVNSSKSANALIAPSPMCIRADNGTTLCTTPTESGTAYLTQSHGLTLIVDPLMPQITWLDDRNLVWVNIVGVNHSVDQLLTLAQAMT